jgi:hypothetical protein
MFFTSLNLLTLSLSQLKIFKMKIKLLTLIMLVPTLAFNQATFSQNFKVTSSKPFQVVDAAIKEYTSVGNGKSISVKTDGEKVIIQLFNSVAMKEEGRKEYVDFPKYNKAQKLLRVNDKLFYISEAFNKKERTFSVYSREIDISTGTFKPIQKLFTTSREVVPIRKKIMSGNIFNMEQVPKFDVISSFDQSKVLIQYRCEPKEKSDAKNYDEIGFYVFNNSMNKLWGKEVKMPHTEKEMGNLAYTINKDGNVFMLSFLYTDKSFELIAISEKNDLKTKVLPVKKGLSFDKFDLRETPQGTILAAGYYSNGIEAKVDWTGTMSLTRNVNGIYIFETDVDGALKKDTDYPFSIELIKKYLSDRLKDKADKKEADGKAGINDLVLRKFVLNPDGSIIIVGEVFYVKPELWFTSKEMVAHFSDMVVTKIDPSGKIVWSEKMPKNQACLFANASDFSSLGISFIQGKSSHYILFIDNRKNANLMLDQPAEPHKGGFGGYLTAYQIDDASGKVIKHTILDLTNINGVKAFQFDTDRIFEVQDKSFLLEIYIKDKLDMMIKMDLIK